MLGCNAAKKNKQDKTKPIKPNDPQIPIRYTHTHIYIYIYIYILLTRISNITSNPQLVLFARLPFTLTIFI